jgi:hypothetical protein
MAQHAERKRGARGRQETLRRRQVRETKYIVRDLPIDLLYI